jgi:hypothetical protein
MLTEAVGAGAADWIGLGCVKLGGAGSAEAVVSGSPRLHPGTLAASTSTRAEMDERRIIESPSPGSRLGETPPDPP